MKRFLLLTAIIGLFSLSAVAQQPANSLRSIKGYVLNANGDTLQGAIVKAVADSATATVGSDGSFVIEVTQYVKFLEASYEGYISAQAEIDGSMIIFKLQVDKKYASNKAKAEKAARKAAEIEAAERAKAAEAARIVAEQEAARLAAEREAARLLAEREAARLVAEREAARIAAEQEIARLAAEKEAARLAAEKAKAEEEARLAAEREAARLAVEKEAARIAAEKEAARLAAEKAKAEEEARLAAEKEAARLAAEKETARLVAEKMKAEEQARIATEKAKAEEAARLAAEKALADERARMATEKAQLEEQIRLAVEKAIAKEKALFAAQAQAQTQTNSVAPAPQQVVVQQAPVVVEQPQPQSVQQPAVVVTEKENVSETPKAQKEQKQEKELKKHRFGHVIELGYLTTTKNFNNIERFDAAATLYYALGGSFLNNQVFFGVGTGVIYNFGASGTQNHLVSNDSINGSSNVNNKLPYEYIGVFKMSDISIPAYLYLKVNMAKKAKVSPFLSLMAGAEFSPIGETREYQSGRQLSNLYQTPIFGRASIGLNFRLNNKSAMYVGIGYRFDSRWGAYTIEGDAMVYPQRYGVHGMTANLGFTF